MDDGYFAENFNHLGVQKLLKEIKAACIVVWISTRKRLRNRLKMELPFSLQKNIGNGKRLIDRVDVLSIDEWNADSQCGSFPVKRVLG